MNSPKPLKLHVGNAILGAFWIVSRQWQTFARAVAVPMLFVVVLMLAWQQTAESLPEKFYWVVWIAYAFLFVLIAVRCHRIVLLRQHAETAWTLPTWSRRETLFVIWGLIAWVAAVLALMFSTMVASVITGFLPGATEGGTIDRDRMTVVGYGAQLIYWYVFARFCLMFPAIAIDEKTNLVLAWETSRGNGWRLFAVVCALPYCISLVVGYAYRNDATLIEYLLLTTIGTALLAVEIAALSFAYQQLAAKPDGD